MKKKLNVPQNLCTANSENLRYSNFKRINIDVDIIS